MTRFADHPQAHIIDLGAALSRSVSSPSALTSGSIRHFPVEPPPERREHGPITNLVRKDRSGCTAYEGVCDGEPVCIIELRPEIDGVPGMWRASKRDSVLGEGTLVEVLRIKAGDPWLAPDGESWTVCAVFNCLSDAMELEAVHEYHGTQLYAYQDVAVFLRNGWRPGE